MIRTKSNNRKPDAILTSDWHLRDSDPPCRTDNFEKAQWNKLDFISDLQKKHNCPILHSGDLFDYWKPSLSFLSDVYNQFPNQFYSIAGNHDLPQHNFDLVKKCGLYLLSTVKKVEILPGVHWGFEPENGDVSIAIKGRKILVWHTMTYQGKVPYPGCTDSPAKNLLKKYTDYDLILTGHNHQTFTEELDGRLLVNPGCITRQESSQADFEPCVWLWYADTNTVEKVLLPIEKNVVQKPENTERLEERNARIDAFVSKLDEDWDSTINFEQNLERAIAVNKTPKEVSEIIYKAIEA